jgi:hypothetical protein
MYKVLDLTGPSTLPGQYPECVAMCHYEPQCKIFVHYQTFCFLGDPSYDLTVVDPSQGTTMTVYGDYGIHNFIKTFSISLVLYMITIFVLTCMFLPASASCW